MTETAALLSFVAGTTPAMLQALARYDWVWIKNAADIPDLSDRASAPSWDGTHGIRAVLKAINPDVRVGIYGWGPLAQPYSPHYGWLTAAMLLHRQDGSALWDRHPTGGPMTMVPNYASEWVRSHLIRSWGAWLAEHDYDGLLLDSWWPDGLAGYVRDTLGLASGCADGQAHLPEWWMAHLGAFTGQLRWWLEANGRSLMVNGISTASFGSPAVAAALEDCYVGLQTYASGVLAEHVHRAYLGEAECWRQIDMVRRAIGKRGRVVLLFQPELLRDTDPAFQWSPGEHLLQFYLALYKLIERPGVTQFGYHPGAPYRAVEGPTVYNGVPPYVWPGLGAYGPLLELGHPVDAGVVPNPTGLAWRRFYGGYAVVNPADESRALPILQPVSVWGGAVAYPPHVNVPPRTGLVLRYV